MRQRSALDCGVNEEDVYSIYLLINACYDTGLAVNTGKTKYLEEGRHQGMMANEHFTIGSNLYEKVKTFKKNYVPFCRIDILFTRK